jgi:predicted nucleotidyltransferase
LLEGLLKLKMIKSQSELEQILNVLTSSLERLKLEYQVKSLGVFGSWVRGQATPNSDLDLLVEFKGDITFDNYMNLKFLLEDLFNRKIDLVIKEDIKPQIREQILEETVYVS